MKLFGTKKKIKFEELLELRLLLGFLFLKSVRFDVFWMWIIQKFHKPEIDALSFCNCRVDQRQTQPDKPEGKSVK